MPEQETPSPEQVAETIGSIGFSEIAVRYHQQFLELVNSGFTRVEALIFLGAKAAVDEATEEVEYDDDEYDRGEE